MSPDKRSKEETDSWYESRLLISHILKEHEKRIEKLEDGQIAIRIKVAIGGGIAGFIGGLISLLLKLK